MATKSVEHGAFCCISGELDVEGVLIVLIGLVKIGVAANGGCGKAADTAVWGATTAG